MDLPLSTLQSFARSGCDCHNGKSEIQKQLDLHNRLCNESGSVEKIEALKANIKSLRGTNPPPCWGEDDCSTMTLIHCPWSIDCGE